MCGLRLLRSYICFATSQISLLTKQTLFIRLFVFCSFAPSPLGYSVSRGVPKIPKKSEFLDSNSLKTARNFSLKSQNFDEIVVFSAGFENSSVLGVHEFSSSAEKAEYRKIMTFYHHLLWTFSANPTISFTSITVPSSRIALPLNLPNT